MITLALTPGHRHETIAFHELMETGAVKRQGRGRPRIRPDRLSGDKAYSSGEIREYLRRHNIRITIPRKKNETSTGKFDKIIYKLRNRIERFINRMKHFRSLATRYDKSASSYRALWIIGAMLLWLQ
jgi:transposase